MANNAYTSDYMNAEDFGALLADMDQICNDMTHELGIAIK